jgi:hypothetical protein
VTLRTGTRRARRAKLQPYPAFRIFAPSVGVLCGGDSVWRLMRVGVYVDAFNLYYGGRAHFGGEVARWRWLDLRALASTLVGEQAASWTQARVMQVTYCTARISARDNASGSRDQDVYLKALLSSGSVDLIEYGYYTSKVKTRPLAVPDRKDRPKLVHPGWPVKVRPEPCLMTPMRSSWCRSQTGKRRVLTSTLPPIF